MKNPPYPPFKKGGVDSHARLLWERTNLQKRLSFMKIFAILLLKKEELLWISSFEVRLRDQLKGEHHEKMAGRGIRDSRRIFFVC